MLRAVGLNGGTSVVISSLTATVKAMLAEKAELHRRLDRFMGDATDDQRRAVWKLVSAYAPEFRHHLESVLAELNAKEGS